MTAVVIGGSSGLGRALCEELAAQGCETIVIVASREDDCRRLADHLYLLHGVNALPFALDAREPADFRDRLLQGVADVGPITQLFLPMGVAFDADRIGGAGDRLRDIWKVNYTAVVLSIEALLPQMVSSGGRIAGFGSIAAIRTRNGNVQYAAAKAALTAYFASLRHSLVTAPSVAQFYVVGYVDSGQSFGRTQLFPPLPARQAARRILHDGATDFGKRYLPSYWAVIALVLRLLPWRIFSRLGF